MTAGRCTSCGKSTEKSEAWSTGQCDDCYLGDHPDPECEYTNCPQLAIDEVDGRKLCGGHTREYREFRKGSGD